MVKMYENCWSFYFFSCEKYLPKDEMNIGGTSRRGKGSEWSSHVIWFTALFPAIPSDNFMNIRNYLVADIPALLADSPLKCNVLQKIDQTAELKIKTFSNWPQKWRRAGIDDANFSDGTLIIKGISYSSIYQVCWKFLVANLEKERSRDKWWI